MTNTCPTTPYKRKDSPYSERQNPYSTKQNPYSSKENPFTEMLSPYGVKYFCPFPRLLMEDGAYLLMENNGKIIL